MRHQPIRRAFGFHLLGCLAERQCFRLREDVGDQYVVMAPQRIQWLLKRHEVARDQPRSLMDQLIERVLPVGARLAPINRARGDSATSVPSSVTCLPLLSMVSCCR